MGSRWAKSAARNLATAGGARRSVAKAGGIRGHFGLCCCGWQIVGSAPEGKSFYGVANRRDGCTMVRLLRPKRKFRLNGLRRLRACAAVGLCAPGAVGAASRAGHLPRLAVSDEYARLVGGGGLGRGLILSKCHGANSNPE